MIRTRVVDIFGKEFGSSPDTKPQYFSAYGWLCHNSY